MPDLQISWTDGSARFKPADSPVLIGRSTTADVPLTDRAISRDHLRLVWVDDTGWIAEDSSTHGTYDSDGQRKPSSWPLGSATEIRLGGTHGTEVAITRITGSDASNLASAIGGARGPSVDSEDDAGLFVASTDRSSRQWSSEAAGSSSETASSAQPTSAQQTIGLSPNPLGKVALRLTVDGQDHTFMPGAEITVGRDPSSKIRLDESHTLVSRRHLRIYHRDESWWIDDVSSKGTWVDGRRLRGPYRAEGAFVAQLGDNDAGTPMRLITGGTHRSPHTISTPLLAVLGLAAVIPIVLLAAFAFRSGNDSLDLDRAKRSTVMLFGLEGGQGSGFFVSDNLILTNQHVAALSPQLLVAVSREPDEPAQIEYATETLANHPFLDIALLRVANPASIEESGPQITSDPVGEIGLPSVEIGDSSDMSIGDPVFSTGFPGRLSITVSDDMGALRLPAVVVTDGQLSNFSLWPGCSNPAMETLIPVESPPGVTCAPNGDVDRGVLLSDFSSSEGASGSPVYNESNQVIGVVYAGSTEPSAPSLDIASNAFTEWLNDFLDPVP